jgi:predicted RNA-binding protein YlqC (UPF0109 family)
MKDALHFLVASIVDNTDTISIEESEQEGVVNFVIHVAQEDMGKLIGKEGKVIRAIRNVMKIPAIKQHKKIHVSIAEEQ